MLMAEPSTAVRFSSTASARFDSSTTSRRLSHSTRLFMPWNKFQRLADGSCMRRNSFVKNRVRASAEEQSGAASSPIKPNAKPSRYHPFEDIVESELMEAGDARLTPAEITRTIIEVNSKATLMFTGFVNEEVHDNIFWPDLPYVTDEYGNIYFQVKNDEDILKTLSAEDNLVVCECRFLTNSLMQYLHICIVTSILRCVCDILGVSYIGFESEARQILIKDGGRGLRKAKSKKEGGSSSARKKRELKRLERTINCEGQKESVDLVGQCAGSDETSRGPDKPKCTVISEMSRNSPQVIIGLDTAELLSEMELAGSSEIDFGIEEIDDEDSDVEDNDDDDDDDDEDEDEDEDEDDNYDGEWVSILEDEEDQEDSDESLGDWAKLETMRFSHPMYFAKKMSEVASDDPIDFMDQPPAGLAVQGLLRPAFIEEHSVIQKHISESNDQSGDNNSDQIERSVEDKVEDIGIINGHRHGPGSAQDSDIWAEELEKGESVRNGTSFYKLEMIKIQLISAHGHQTFVEVEDFRKARPDAIAHSAAKIISRLKAGGEKTTQALKSLCWRCKGIQVEEATLIGVDALGFDLRICSGTQVQTLRFTFNKRASSEYSAERQLNDLLFPRTHHKLQKKKEARQTEL
ncbi:hypothetical protein HYC85_013292 [Camellia sinensis]|uniref:FMN-binding split barrel n=1 Tax=Camellia sinensis TaxID=4442 RepID=A0A7J7H4A2_CAMSI|nr:hypothetical protein HYC85_013292 [Camellia sinensis]